MENLIHCHSFSHFRNIKKLIFWESATIDFMKEKQKRNETLKKYIKKSFIEMKMLSLVQKRNKMKF